MPLSSEQLEAMSTEQRVLAACELSCFPCLTYDEIADWFGVRTDTVHKYIKQGRARGYETHRSVHGSQRHGLTPSDEEWAWRFEHQSAAQIAARFGDETLDLLREARLQDSLPPDLERLLGAGRVREATAARALGEVEPEDLPEAASVFQRVGNTRRHRILDTAVEIELEHDDEKRIAANMVQAVLRRYRVEGPEWESVVPAIQVRLLAARAAREAGEEGSSVNKADKVGSLVNRLGTTLRNLGLTPRTTDDEAAFMMRAIATAPQYLAERGWRETLACPRCGTMIPFLWVAYRSIAEFLHLCRGVVEARFLPAAHLEAIKDAAHECLHEVREHPYLAHELRDLGHAWSGPVVAVLDEFDELDEPLKDRLRRRLLAAIFEVGEECFDTDNPYMAIGRVRYDPLSGRQQVDTPQG